MTFIEAKKVLDILYAQWPNSAIPRFFARNKEGRCHGTAILGAEDLAVESAWADRARFNSYIQMNPSMSRTGIRCSAEDITHWSFFLVDIDPTGPDPDLDGAEEAVRSILSNYLGIINLHATVIDSGRGRQLWFPLEKLPLYGHHKVWSEPHLTRNLEPIADLEPKTLQTIKAAPRAMAYWHGLLRDRTAHLRDVTIDTSVSDLARVMRLPYTINQKTGRMATILSSQPGPNVGMAHKLISYAPYKLWADRPEVMISNGKWPEYLSSMTRGGRIFLTEGSTEPGRHHAASAAMLSLLDLGCPIDEIKAALRFGGSLCDPILPASDTDAMCERRRNAVE